MRNTPFYAARLVLAAMLCSLVLLVAPGCQRDSGSRLESTAAETPDQEVGDFSLTESVEGTKKWTLWADWAAIFNEKSKVHAKIVRIDFFREDGTRFSELKADSGVLSQDTNDMEALGSVVVVTEDGIRLETESLRWLNVAQQIVSEDFVKITKGRDVLTGVGLVSDPSLNEFEIKSHVQAFVIDEEGKLIPQD
ncbi:MAG: LPS export ABC transporter periplasmic protein LptC [Candidatus Eiseniibacteriota bacterium]|nr:MAG: LPS export ABC transporter periplasmic protein LptC [Candidatus Eisenbacteria bacterium]